MYLPSGAVKMASRELHRAAIFDALASDGRLSQRELARRFGIALGTTNGLLQELMTSGWIEFTSRRSRSPYRLTAAGVRARRHAGRTSLAAAVPVYRAVCDRVAERFAALAGVWKDDHPSVVLYGPELAEIAYVCAVGVGLKVTAVIASEPLSLAVADAPVCPPDVLAEATVRGLPFDRLVVTSTRPAAEIRSELRECGVAIQRVIWL